MLVCALSIQARSDQNESTTQIQPDSANCQPYANTEPLCLFSNPEDLAVLPNKAMLIVSEYGAHGGTQPGALVFYDIENQQRLLAFKGGDGNKPKEYWGDHACTEPPGKPFSPHGIDLSQRTDGRLQLLAVQHGGRESIEFFEVKGNGNDWQLVWRGCAVAPENAKLNSVAAGRSGEFFTTRMQAGDSSWESGDGEQHENSSTNAQASGVVYRWNHSAGFTPVIGSEGAMPNGIAASKNGKLIYVVYSGQNQLKKINTVSGEVLATIALPPSDNIKWAADRKTLLVASFVGSEKSDMFVRCMTTEVEVCAIEFAITELNPDTLSRKTLFHNPQAPMGAGTTGLKVDSTLFIGSFSGNRLLQVDLEQGDK